jgi:hypothetical protein
MAHDRRYIDKEARQLPPAAISERSGMAPKPGLPRPDVRNTLHAANAASSL